MFWLASLFTIVLIVLSAAGAMASGIWTPWAQAYVQGVDVSQHQGAIDWNALARAGVRFAYVKATEGSDYFDPRFETNFREARRAGLYRGAYHYFTLCRRGAAQAANFLRTVPRAPDALPPALDLEHMGRCRLGPTMTDVDAEIRAFLDAVEARTGVRPILYVTREFHDAHLSEFPRERFWIRSLYMEPSFRQREWVIWQHHNGARRPGIDAPVDLDAFRGDDAGLARFAQGSSNAH